MTRSLEDFIDTAPIAVVADTSVNEPLLADYFEDIAQAERLIRRRLYYTAIGASAIILALANVPAAAENISASTNHSDLNNKTSEIASLLIGQDVRVDCNDERLDQADTPRLFLGDLTPNERTIGHVRPQQLGAFPIAPPVMTVRTEICDAVVDFSFKETVANDDEMIERYNASAAYGIAAYILLHEGEHIQQVFNEADASCFAIQKLPAALEKSGFNEKYTDMIAEHTAWDISKLHPEEYFSDDCMPGGTLDLAISDNYLFPHDTLIAKYIKK